MWEKLRRNDRSCTEYREALEELCPGVDRVAALAELRTHLTPKALAHVESCDFCAESTEIFWDSRNLLAIPLRIARGEQAETLEAPGAWFATRVMTSIAEREAEGRRKATEWIGAVSHMASRLAWVSAVALLVTSTWLYTPDNGQRKNAAQEATVETTPQYLFDGSTASSNFEDALVSPAER